MVEKGSEFSLSKGFTAKQVIFRSLIKIESLMIIYIYVYIYIYI